MSHVQMSSYFTAGSRFSFFFFFFTVTYVSTLFAAFCSQLNNSYKLLNTACLVKMPARTLLFYFFGADCVVMSLC